MRPYWNGVEWIRNGVDVSRYKWIWIEAEKDLKWLRSRLGADKDPWIQSQIAKIEAEIDAEIDAEIQLVESKDAAT